MTAGEDLDVFARMTLRRTDVADAAVAMIHVVPVHEPSGPLSGIVQRGKAFTGELRPVLRGSEQRFDIGVVITDPTCRVPQPI